MEGWIFNERQTRVEFIKDWEYRPSFGSDPAWDGPKDGEDYLHDPKLFSERKVREDRVYPTERVAKEALIAWNREWIAKRQRGIARRERANARLEASMLEPAIEQTSTDLAPTLGGR